MNGRSSVGKFEESRKRLSDLVERFEELKQDGGRGDFGPAPEDLRLENVGTKISSHFLLFIPVFFSVLLFVLLLGKHYSQQFFYILCLSFLPVAVMSFAGLLKGSLEGAVTVPLEIAAAEMGEKKVVFQVTTTAATSALLAVVESVLLHAPKYLSGRFRIDVVLKEGGEGEEEEGVKKLRELESSGKINLLLLPANISLVALPQKLPMKVSWTRSRLKHYAVLKRREKGENTADTFVCHLSAETLVGEDTVLAIKEFVLASNGEGKLAAEAVLTFPYAGNLLTFFCDALRTANNLSARGGAGAGGFTAPFHGAGLVVRSDVEEEIGWWGVESSAMFASEFIKKYGRKKSGFLRGRVYVKSAKKTRELLEQRRRWFVRTVYELKGYERRMRLEIFVKLLSWFISPFAHPLVLLAGVGLLRLFAGETLLSGVVPSTLLSPFVAFCFAVLIFCYFVGVLENLKVSPRGQGKERIRELVKIFGLSPVLICVATLVESFSVIYALFKPEEILE